MPAATPKKKTKKASRQGHAPGWMRRGGFRRITVSASDRWAMYDSIQRLHDRLGRPVRQVEIAQDLSLPLDDVHPYSLVMARMVRPSPVPGFDEMGFVPADLTIDLRGALDALDKLPAGQYDFRVREGNGYTTQTLTVNRGFKSRIRGLLKRAMPYLGIRHYGQLTADRLPQLLEAVRQDSMARSNVPESDWTSQTPRAKRARKNALNRVGECRRFLQWSESEGYVDLRFFHLRNKSRTPMLSRAWAAFHDLVPIVPRRDHALTLARRAMAFGANSPEELVEAGFERFEQWLAGQKRYNTTAALRGFVHRARQTWNERATVSDHLPQWDGPGRHMQGRLPDGGLVRTWWSPKRALLEKPGILDEPGMECQKEQAHNIRDWWTLADPTVRPDSVGGPLPPRPAKAHEGGRRIGASTEDQPTAYKPLASVSRFCRFVMTYDPEVKQRIPLDKMKMAAWDELYLNLSQVLRFIHYEMQLSADEHDGRLVKTQGTDAALYVRLLTRVYFTAWVNRALERLDDEEIDLPDQPDADERQKEIRRKRSKLLKKRKELEHVADKAIEYFRREEERLGGMRPRKAKNETADNLSHEDISRIADAYRQCRLDTEEELRRQTKRLQENRVKARARPCDARLEDKAPCGVIGCDVHHPTPTIVDGIATELLYRTYAFLCMKELWARFPALVPFRPSEFCRTQIGVHLNPKTLEYSAPRYKNPRSRGVVQRREVHVPTVKPIAGLDPGFTPKLVDVLERVLSLAQPYLASNPTPKGARLKVRHPNNDRHLFLTWDGLCLASSRSLHAMIAHILEEGANMVNASLKPGEPPIVLPTGWGAKGSYVFRFLWGHRSVEEGASMSSVALALGNSESTTRQYYQRVRSDTAINSVADTTRNSGKKKEDSDDVPPAVGNKLTFYDEVDVLCERKEKGLIDEAGYSAAYADLKKKHGIQ